MDHKMRGAASLIVALAGLAFVAPASAQTARPAPATPPAARTAAAPVSCINNPNVLGVSRVVEIDTTGGPRFGHLQYKDINFLADGEVVLTFDDGPLKPHTKPILDALDAQCTKATFFMVGQMALAEPAMAKEVARRGHTIGTHTWSHANLARLTPLKARNEIELGISAVQHAVGTPISPFFRFPYLSASKSILGYIQSRNLSAFSIEADSYDYRSKDAAAVHKAILNQLAVRHKGILLFHDIQPATARALPGLLAALKAKGYRIVHMKAKAPVTTLPEFDLLALNSAARNKLMAGTDQPRLIKASTWPAQATSPHAGTSVVQTVPQPGAPVAPAGTAQVRPHGDDWRGQIFRTN
jgi:peptidoglycan/xylan/chitin deacetylase (PgdA/CDA1 family)